MTRFPLRLFGPLAASVAVIAGCDVPTEAPIVDQRWIIPAEEVSISVAELLPTGVTIAGSNFAVTVDPFTVSETLGDACPICIDSGGFTVPSPPGIPGFSTDLSVGETLPNDVASVAIATGSSIQFQINNGLGFNPIAGGGHVEITLRNGPAGAVLGSVEWDSGAGDVIGPGVNTRTLNLAPGSVSGFAIEVDVLSVGGQSAPIDTDAQFTVTATPTILVSSVTVSVPSKVVDFDQVELDVEGLEDGFTDRIQAGGINFEVQNPFGVTIVANLDIVHPTGTITKLVNITGAATSTVSLTYTGQEFKDFLGEPGVTFSGSGTANAGSVTITPTMELIMQPELDLTVRVGG